MRGYERYSQPYSIDQHKDSLQIEISDQASHTIFAKNDVCHSQSSNLSDQSYQNQIQNYDVGNNSKIIPKNIDPDSKNLHPFKLIETNIDPVLNSNSNKQSHTLNSYRKDSFQGNLSNIQEEHVKPRLEPVEKSLKKNEAKDDRDKHYNHASIKEANLAYKKENSPNVFNFNPYNPSLPTCGIALERYRPSKANGDNSTTKARRRRFDVPPTTLNSNKNFNKVERMEVLTDIQESNKTAAAGRKLADVPLITNKASLIIQHTNKNDVLPMKNEVNAFATRRRRFDVPPAIQLGREDSNEIDIMKVEENNLDASLNTKDNYGRSTTEPILQDQGVGLASGSKSDSSLSTLSSPIISENDNSSVKGVGNSTFVAKSPNMDLMDFGLNENTEESPEKTDKEKILQASTEANLYNEKAGLDNLSTETLSCIQTDANSLFSKVYSDERNSIQLDEEPRQSINKDTDDAPDSNVEDINNANNRIGNSEYEKDLENFNGTATCYNGDTSDFNSIKSINDNYPESIDNTLNLINQLDKDSQSIHKNTDTVLETQIGNFNGSSCEISNSNSKYELIIAEEVDTYNKDDEITELESGFNTEAGDIISHNHSDCFDSTNKNILERGDEFKQPVLDSSNDTTQVSLEASNPSTSESVDLNNFNLEVIQPTKEVQMYCQPTYDALNKAATATATQTVAKMLKLSAEEPIVVGNYMTRTLLKQLSNYESREKARELKLLNRSAKKLAGTSRNRLNKQGLKVPGAPRVKKVSKSQLIKLRKKKARMAKRFRELNEQRKECLVANHIEKKPTIKKPEVLSDIMELNQFLLDALVEVQDRYGIWCEARIVEVRDNKVRVEYFDALSRGEWVNQNANRIRICDSQPNDKAFKEYTSSSTVANLDTVPSFFEVGSKLDDKLNTFEFPTTSTNLDLETNQVVKTEGEPMEELHDHCNPEISQDIPYVWTVYCNRCSMFLDQYSYSCTACEAQANDFTPGFDLCQKCFYFTFPRSHLHPKTAFFKKILVEEGTVNKYHPEEVGGVSAYFPGTFHDKRKASNETQLIFSFEKDHFFDHKLVMENIMQEDANKLTSCVDAATQPNLQHTSRMLKRSTNMHNPYIVGVYRFVHKINRELKPAMLTCVFCHNAQSNDDSKPESVTGAFFDIDYPFILRPSQQKQRRLQGPNPNCKVDNKPTSKSNSYASIRRRIDSKVAKGSATVVLKRIYTKPGHRMRRRNLKPLRFLYSKLQRSKPKCFSNPDDLNDIIYTHFVGKPTKLLRAYLSNYTLEQVLERWDCINRMKLEKYKYVSYLPKYNTKVQHNLWLEQSKYTDVFWCHINCAKFAPKVLLFNNSDQPDRTDKSKPVYQIYNLSRAVWESNKNKCSKCREKGATVGCGDTGCYKYYHLKCSNKSLSFYESGMIFYCEYHENRLKTKQLDNKKYNCNLCFSSLSIKLVSKKSNLIGKEEKDNEDLCTWFTCSDCILIDQKLPFDLCAQCYETKLDTNTHNHQRTSFKPTDLSQRDLEVKDILEIVQNKNKRRKDEYTNKDLERAIKNFKKSLKRIQCAYCWTNKAKVWRKGYSGVIMCEKCFEGERASTSIANLSHLKENGDIAIKVGGSLELPQPDTTQVALSTSIPPKATADFGETTDLISNIIIKEEDIKSESNLLKGYKYNHEDYNHLPYYTRVACDSNQYTLNASQLKDLRMLESYEPQSNQWHTLLLQSTYYDIPGRAPRWATHSGSDYHGTWLPQTVRRALLRYTKPNSKILSNFLGRGTDAIESFLLNRKCVGIDINPLAVTLSQRNCSFMLPFESKIKASNRPVILQGDSRQLSNHALFKDEGFDHVLSHPPYKDCVSYSTNIPGDLSKFANTNEFQTEMAKVIDENWRVLKLNGRVTLGIGDNREHCFYVPVGYQLLRTYLDRGFEVEEIILKRQRHCQMFGLGAYLSAHHDFLIFTHEYIITLKKVKRNKVIPVNLRTVLKTPDAIQNWKAKVDIRYVRRQIPTYPMERKSVIMGTVWVFRPKPPHYPFEKLCKSRMVEKFGKDNCNWEEVYLEFKNGKEDLHPMMDPPEEKNYDEVEVEEQSEYEKKRELKVKENTQMLLSLGLTAELGDERSEDYTYHDNLMLKQPHPTHPLNLIVVPHIPNYQLPPNLIPYYRKALTTIAHQAYNKLPISGQFIVGVQDCRLSKNYHSKLIPLTLLVLEDIKKVLEDSQFCLKEMVVCVPDGYQCNRNLELFAMPVEPSILDIKGKNPIPHVPIVHAIYLVFMKLS